MLRLSTGLVNSMAGAGVSGGSLQQLLSGGTIDIYTGTQPIGADSIESGTLLVSITLDGNTFTPGASGASTNGLTFDDAIAGVLSKSAAEAWSGLGVAVGSAGWFRFYDSNKTSGVSTTAIRFDGSVASSGGQIYMSSTSIAVDSPIVITAFTVTLPTS